MTQSEAKAYLETIVPETANIVTLDAAVWADFKASMLQFLDNPGVDTKYKIAVESIDTIVKNTLP